MQRSSNLLALTIERYYEKIEINKKDFKILRRYIPGIELNLILLLYILIIYRY